MRKKKFLKKSFLQVCCDYHSVFGLSFDVYIRACAREKAKKMLERGMFLCMYYAIEYKKIRFEALFKLVEREKTENGIVIGYWQNKRSDGL